MRSRTFWVVLMGLAAIIAGEGCGSSSGTAAAVISGISSVAVTCTPTAVAAGATSQCAATVQGTGQYTSGVNWSTTAGTVTSGGMLTAPTTAGSVTVTATSTQDPTKAGTAAVTVQAQSSGATITSVAVNCSPATVAPGGSSQCSAAVQGTGNYSSGVSWSASAGTIGSSGTLTAPATAGSVTVTATSTQDPTKSGTATVTVQAQTSGGVTSKHVVVVMEENQSYGTVVGNTADWPNLNGLITHGALPTNYYADTHPSIGNYFMLTTGQILTNDDGSTKVWNVDNLARRILAAGVPFRVYAEGITQGYVGGNKALYVIRHNPFAMLSDVADNATVANAVIWPFTQFGKDLASGNLPEFSFIVPDLNDDAHNGTPKKADQWLQSNVVALLSNDAAFQAGGDGVLIVDFDEAATADTTHGGGHVSPVLWGPIVRSGYQQTSATLYRHESLLRTLMELLQLANPPGAAANAPDMMEFFGP